MFKKLLAATAIALVITACGGSSGGSPAGASGPSTGYFKDSNTSGLSYVSGAQSGVTGTDGSFTYEAGQPVTFSVGGVTLGTVSSGKSIGTPVDLVSAGSSNTTSVKNIVRFLMMLDKDANPSNGINISTAVQAAAKNWAQLDFSLSTFDTAASPVIASVNAADVRNTAALPSAVTAKAHLEATLRCAYSGAYKGTYSGGDSGNFGAMIDTQSGLVTGVTYSIPGASYSTLTGTTPINYSQNVAFTSGNTTTGATFSGQYSSVDSVSGTWNNTYYGVSGSFSGSRIGGALNAKYRLTGQYYGSDYGLFSVDIDNTGKVTGVGYSVTDGALFTLSGTATQLTTTVTITATASNGGTISASLNLSTDMVNGTWVNTGAGASGSFSGSGCFLN